jgi:hypothetical protein
MRLILRPPRRARPTPHRSTTASPQTIARRTITTRDPGRLGGAADRKQLVDRRARSRRNAHRSAHCLPVEGKGAETYRRLGSTRNSGTSCGSEQQRRRGVSTRISGDRAHVARATSRCTGDSRDKCRGVCPPRSVRTAACSSPASSRRRARGDSRRRTLALLRRGLGCHRSGLRRRRRPDDPRVAARGGGAVCRLSP